MNWGTQTTASFRVRICVDHKDDIMFQDDRLWIQYGVSRHDIAGIWVAFFSRCQRFRCSQVSQCMVPGTSPENAIVHKCKCSPSLLRFPQLQLPFFFSRSLKNGSGCLCRFGW